MLALLLAQLLSSATKRCEADMMQHHPVGAGVVIWFVQRDLATFSELEFSPFFSISSRSV
jgi:hypothetical protein